MIISKPRQGLDSLQSYHMYVSKNFSGEADGADVRSNLEIEADVAGDDRFISIHQEDEDGSTRVLIRGVKGDASYSRTGGLEAACRVTWDTAEKLIPEIWPADLLPVIAAATRIGTDTIDSIPAVHYSLDKSSAGEIPVEDLTGDLWMAEADDYVLKLNMTISGTEKTFGPDRSGTQILKYELSRINSNTPIILPEGCQPVLEDIPVMQDATDIHRYTDSVRYVTYTTVEKVLSFYKEQLEAGGWKAGTGHPYSENGQIILFLHPDKPESLLLDVTNAGKGWRVNIARLQLAVKKTTQPGTLNGATPERVSTLDPLKSGLPAEIPIYVGAKNFGGYEGIFLEFTVVDPADKVKEFYKSSLKKVNWVVAPGTENVPSAPLIFRKGESMVIIQLADEAGGTHVIIRKLK
jgi:hypothetical protein